MSFYICIASLIKDSQAGTDGVCIIEAPYFVFTNTTSCLCVHKEPHVIMNILDNSLHEQTFITHGLLFFHIILLTHLCLQHSALLTSKGHQECSFSSTCIHVWLECRVTKNIHILAPFVLCCGTQVCTLHEYTFDVWYTCLHQTVEPIRSLQLCPINRHLGTTFRADSAPE